MRLLRRGVERYALMLDKLCLGISLSVGAAVILTVMVISYGVLAREVFHLSDVWVTEVTTYLMAYMTFVGLAALAWQSQHLKVDVVGHYVGPAAARWLTIFSCALVTSVAIVIALLGVAFWRDAYDSGERSWGMFSVPLWIPYLCFTGGSLLFAFLQASRLMVLVVGVETASPNDGPTLTNASSREH